MKKNTSVILLSLLIINSSMQAGKKTAPKVSASAATTEPQVSTQEKVTQVAVGTEKQPAQPTPAPAPIVHPDRPAMHDEVQSSSDSEEDNQLAPAHSSKRFVPEPRSERAHEAKHIESKPMLDDWDFGSIPAEQQKSALTAFVGYLRKQAVVSAKALKTIALALDLRTNLDHLGSIHDPQLLATKIAALNSEKTGSGTTIAFNACREAMKTRDTSALKSLLEAIKMLGLQRELGETDRNAINAYAQEIANREADDLKEAMTASAEAIRGLAEMSRMVAPSGRSTPPVTDETIASCAQATTQRIMDTASVGRFIVSKRP